MEQFTSPRVIPVYVRAENPFQFWKDSAAQSVVDVLFKDTPAGGKVELFGQRFSYGDMMNKITQGNWAILEDPNTIKAIKELGHDGIYVREGGVTNLAVFDPNQLKSQFNSGKFGETPNISATENGAGKSWVKPKNSQEEFDVRLNYISKEDLQAALQIRFNQGNTTLTRAQQIVALQEPEKHISKKEAAVLLRTHGPMSDWSYDPQTLPSYDQKTGEFKGSELLTMMLGDVKNRGYKLIIKQLIKLTKQTEGLSGTARLRFAMDLNPQGRVRNETVDRQTGKILPQSAANYEPNQNTIYFGSSGLTQRTIIHEVVHGFTSRFVVLYPEDSRTKALQFIFDSLEMDPIFQERVGNKTKPEYGLTNLKEFISEAFSNSIFQAKLLSHSVTGLSKYDPLPDGMGNEISALKAIANQVRKILGIQEKSATNTLEEVIIRIGAVMEASGAHAEKIDKAYHSRYQTAKTTPGITPWYVPPPPKLDVAFRLDAAKKKSYAELLEGLRRANNTPSKDTSAQIEKRATSAQIVDEDDVKANVLDDIAGVQYVAKDPVVDEKLIEKMSKEKDGSNLWAITPGGLARAIDSGSTLVMTGYRFLDNASKRTAYLTKQLVAPVEKSIVKILQSEEKGRILHNIFMRELRNKNDYTADELRSAGVSDDVILAHLEFRNMMDQVLARENLARADKGLEKVDRLQSFLTARWSGPYRANIRDSEGKVVWQVAEQSRRQANKARDYILARDPSLKADDVSYKEGLERSDSVEAGYYDMLKLLDPTDPRVQVLQSIHEEYILGKTEDVAQQEKHFMRKTGVRGYAGDRPWSKEDYKDFFVQQFAYAKNGLKWSEYQTAVDKLKPLMANPEIQEQKNNLAYLKEYSKLHLGFGTLETFSRFDNFCARVLGTSPENMQSAMGAAKTYFYLTRLGLSIPFTITQFIQPAITTPAWHTQLSTEGFKHNPVNTAVMGTINGVGAAMWHYTKLLGGNPSFMESHMDKVDIDAMRWMEANGIVEINQLADIKRDLRPQSVKTLAYPFEFTIKHSETIARSIAFMSFVQHLKQSNMFDLTSAKGKAELFEKAEDMTKLSMVDYRTTERAMIFERGGLVGDAAATLHSYQFNNLFQMWHFIGEAKKGNPKPLLNMMFMQFLAAGTLGLWFIDDLDDLFENMKQLLMTDQMYAEYQNWGIKSFILEHFSDFFAYGGVSKIGGTNMHTRMTAANQIPIWPFEPINISTVQGFAKSVGDMAGAAAPFAGTTGNLFGAAWDQRPFANVPTREKWESAYAAAPAVAQGPMESLPAFNDGKMSKSPSDLGKGERRRTEYEKSLRNYGLRSTAEQRKKDMTWGNTKIEIELDRRLKRASEKATKHILDGNTKNGVKEIIDYVSLGGEPQTILNNLPKARMREVTTELERRALEAGSGSRASILKLKRYIDNVGVQ